MGSNTGQDSDDDHVEGQFDDAADEDPVMVKNLRNHVALFGLSVQDDSAMFAEDADDFAEDSDEDDLYEYYEEHVGPNCQRKSELTSGIHTVDDFSKKFASKISVEKYGGANLTSEAGNRILSNAKKSDGHKMKVKDKQDRATVEQVMDPRTRMILFKLIASDKIGSIDGCISTGKEANVYHASGPNETSYAIKIYKTSILTFRARDKYVSGDFRFRQGYSKKNPRKMVRTWAEKEFRNLSRIHASGTVKVPCPRILKSHVVVMDFIGENGWPCPLLQDVKFDLIDFSADHLQEFVKKDSAGKIDDDNNNPLQLLLKKLYRDCLVLIYRLYKHCRLVHADFSSFNLILIDYKDLYVIDVSQSVEHDHPRSLDFLRSDLKNVQDFFGKRGVLVGDDESIFNYVTSPNVTDANCDFVLDSVLAEAKRFEEYNVDNEVFRNTYIPKKMDDVVRYERDIKKAKKGKELVYTQVLGLKADLSGVADAPTPDAAEGINETSQQDVSSDSDSDTESGEDEEGGKSGTNFKNAARPRNETSEEKRERKKAVKEGKAAKRETKVKKHIKKRKEKLAHANSKR